MIKLTRIYVDHMQVFVKVFFLFNLYFPHSQAAIITFYYNHISTYIFSASKASFPLEPFV